MFGNLTLNESMEAKPYDEQKNNGKMYPSIIHDDFFRITEMREIK